jgi:hypothetical protein
MNLGAWALAMEKYRSKACFAKNFFTDTNLTGAARMYEYAREPANLQRCAALSVTYPSTQGSNHRTTQWRQTVSAVHV